MQMAHSCRSDPHRLISVPGKLKDASGFLRENGGVGECSTKSCIAPVTAQRPAEASLAAPHTRGLAFAQDGMSRKKNDSEKS